jgi:hypothetical protein
MRRPAFVVTIDTEGDDIWSNPSAPTTENVSFLPRFQELCEEHGFKPTYLANHEVVTSGTFPQFARRIVLRAAGEIGLHVHAWNSPPLTGIGEWDRQQVYITELPDELMYAKMDALTRLIVERIEVRPTSHRAGRWAFDGRVARCLERLGYLVDCSVTPGVSWRRYKGSLDGAGGPSYRGYPVHPYFLDRDAIHQPGDSPILEVPVTIRPLYSVRLQRAYERVELGLGGRLIRKVLGSPCSWLRPTGSNLQQMLDVAAWALDQDLPVLEFMLHSSELMPGGSPSFPTADSIENLYVQLRALFRWLVSRGVQGQTLTEFRWTQGSIAAELSGGSSAPLQP